MSIAGILVTDISCMEGERVLLLKGERGDPPTGSGNVSDAYKDLLEREGFHVTLVPVLQFNYVNSSLVSPMLASPTASSLVLTSTRAVTALSQALQEESDSVLNSWKGKKVFCVGPGTAKATQVLFPKRAKDFLKPLYRSCLACLRWERTRAVQQFLLRKYSLIVRGGREWSFSRETWPRIQCVKHWKMVACWWSSWWCMRLKRAASWRWTSPPSNSQTGLFSSVPQVPGLHSPSLGSLMRSLSKWWL